MAVKTTVHHVGTTRYESREGPESEVTQWVEEQTQNPPENQEVSIFSAVYLPSVPEDQMRVILRYKKVP